MGEATAILIDHGRLSERYFAALDRLFRNSDAHFLVERPARRPAIVKPISERAKSEYVGAEWAEGATTLPCLVGRAEAELTALSAVSSTPGVVYPKDPGTRWVVIGESSWLRWLDWKLATETRMGVRLEIKSWRGKDASPDGPLDFREEEGEIQTGQALDSNIARFDHLTADEYISRARAEASILVRNDAYRFETPGGHWIAINPALAEYLGWRPAPDGLFRWLDAAGVVTAESIWWQDGFAQQRPPLFEEEVGHGWLVRVSVDGWQQISAAVGACIDWRRVARFAQEQLSKRVVEWAVVPDEDSRSTGV
jgi:hypothetical protein